MVDMEVRIGLEPSHHKIDEALECLLLIEASEDPIRSVGDGGVGGCVGIAEEVFEPTFSDERIAFQVEKDVALRWRGKAGEPESRRYRQKFMQQRSRFAAR